MLVVRKECRHRNDPPGGRMYSADILLASQKAGGDVEVLYFWFGEAFESENQGKKKKKNKERLKCLSCGLSKLSDTVLFSFQPSPECQTLHAFIVKRLAHINPLCAIATETEGQLCCYRDTPQAHFSLQISELIPSEARYCCLQAALASTATFWTFWTTADASEITLRPPLPPPSSLRLSGDEVGLWDDALHFVIGRVCCCLVVTDGHFMSVGLKKNK